MASTITRGTTPRLEGQDVVSALIRLFARIERRRRAATPGQPPTQPPTSTSSAKPERVA